MRKNFEKQLNYQRIIILILTVLMVFSLSSTITYAIYSRAVRDQAHITFADPVNVFVSINDELTSHIDQDNGVKELLNRTAYPGTRIKLKLGFQLGTNDLVNYPNLKSSSAYVRVRATTESTIELGEGESEDELIVFRTKPDLNFWVPVLFEDGLWWVFAGEAGEYNPDPPPTPTPIDPDDPNSPLAPPIDPGTQSLTQYIASEVINAEKHLFIDGEIMISTKLDNRYAREKIIVNFEVSAVQFANIENPLLYARHAKDEEGKYMYYDFLDSSVPIYDGATWGVLPAEE